MVLGLRGRLLIVVAVALLPAIGLVAWRAIEDFAEARRIAQRDLDLVASTTAVHEKSVLELIRSQLASLSRIVTERVAQKSACSELLGDVLRENRAFVNLGVGDPIRGRCVRGHS